MKEKPKKSSSEFYCSECNKAFNGHIALFNHQRWHANHTDDSAKRFPCEECGKVFMTLTFYYRHQRTAHSNETPAKSFLHQVCQLQKKAFECKDCGLKFSRASALHSHELHHTDVFKETEKGGQMRTSLLPQESILESERKETEQEQIESEYVHPSTTAEEDSHVNETDEDGMSYEPGDFNVQVISASESEDEPVQDLNPDLELQCESDQEGRDDCDSVISHSNIISKPGMDLKIVQIDFEHADAQCAPITGEIENTTTGERFDCPECYRWFSSSSSLRVHRMWHGIHKRRQQTQGAHCENKHGKYLKAADREGDGLNSLDQVPDQVDIHFSGTESVPSKQKPKAYQCPLCFMTFAKARGLRAHKWQAHSKRGKNKFPLSTKKECFASGRKLKKTEDSPAFDSTTVMVRNSPVGSGKKKFSSNPQPLQSITCLDCGKQCSSAGALLDHKKVCLEVKPESKQDIHTPETTGEVSAPLSGLFEHTAKLLFKCDKCGKAFQTEEQLGTHKSKAKSRPFCCALCCHGFWAENQLQQHLAWHDEVRCRLPNEVRYRLSAALTSRPLKPSTPSADTRGKLFPSLTLNPDSQSPSSHKCQHCGKAFLSPTALQKHETQHCNSDSYHCSICPRTFSEIQDLIDHHQECIVKQGGLECQDCGLTFTHWKFFRTHLHQHALEEDDDGEEDDEEEEEEAQMEVNRNPAPDRVSWRVHDGENGDEGTGCDAEDSDMSSSSQAKPSGLGVGAAAALTTEEPQKVYTCLDCGKSYTYLVSFRKHQKLHTTPPPTTKSVQNLRNYDCPECGLSFIRRARLLGHLRVHESHSRCDQCNKEFDCQESWMVHVKLHERNPFWCLSCSKGFKEEAALNKHLQSHNQKQRERKRRNSFQMSALLRSYFTIHSGPKPYQCTACGKRFFHLGNLILHRKKYHGAKTGSGGMKDCAVFAKKQVKTEEKRFSLTSDEEQPGMDINIGELSGGEEGETQQQSVEFWDPANFEESYCGEPVRHFKSPKSTLAGFDAPDELRSEVVRPQAGQELDQSESEETGMDKERRYWEWECCLCDVGFDEVEKLHLHYIKHATGELPIPQDY
ncbi:hypothetical protein L3Q82_002342 [Scortum barcoo]|uniref:Uncharacterized protein n=1 Tax=Scortum barcoo TaxID=214431 RepID=A0ACB8VYD8_9TELE|nr:hypothetical protein L3Q82_002342 [Scortum barcoo]